MAFAVGAPLFECNAADAIFCKNTLCALENIHVGFLLKTNSKVPNFKIQGDKAPPCLLHPTLMLDNNYICAQSHVQANQTMSQTLLPTFTPFVSYLKSITSLVSYLKSICSVCFLFQKHLLRFFLILKAFTPFVSYSKD